MKIAILGRTRALAQAALHLASAGHRIVLVGTCAPAPEYGFGPEDFQALAEKFKAPFFNDPRINSPEIVARLRASGADIGISINWLTVVGSEAITSFPHGILNCHGGDLPRYRGNACFNWAILEGEKRVAVCVHFMEPGRLDSGPVLVRRFFHLTENTTIGQISAEAERQFPEMFLEAVNGLADGGLTPLPQPEDPELSLRCYPRIPSDSRLDFRRPATELDRLVRASSDPLPGAYSFHRMRKLTVWKSSVRPFPAPSLHVPGQVLEIDRRGGPVTVACGRDCLILREIQMEGETKRRSPAEIIASTRDRLGLEVEDEIHRLWRAVEELQKR